MTYICSSTRCRNGVAKDCIEKCKSFNEERTDLETLEVNAYGLEYWADNIKRKFDQSE